MRPSTLRIGSMACCFLGVSMVLFAWCTSASAQSSMNKPCTECGCPDAGANQPCRRTGGTEACNSTETCNPCAESTSLCQSKN